MKETTRQLFDRAVDAIEAADILLTVEGLLLWLGEVG